MHSPLSARNLALLSRGSMLAAGLAAALAAAPAAAQGTQIVNPQLDPNSPNGATWTDLGGGNWLFTLNGQSVIINFDQFGIPAGAQVEFTFSGGVFYVLNRVLGDFPSIINGTLWAPGGHVFLVNPAGVMIGNGALLNVGSLYAAAGSMSNDAFLAAVGGGEISFTGLMGSIVNHGTIEAASQVALLGGSIVNNGLIRVGDAGVVTLVAATGDVTLLPNSMDPQMFVRIDSAGGAPASAVGIELGAEGRIETGSGGRIRMGAADIYAVAIRNQAGSSLAAAAGSVQLQGAAIEQFGSIETGSLGIGSFQDAAPGAGPGAASTLTVSGTINADTAAIDGSVVLAGATTFTGESGQATSVSISGGVTGAGESLTLDAAAASVGGDMGAAGSEIGDLVASGDLAIGGDVFAASVAIDGEASFTNDGAAQTMTALGSIALGSAAKADGDLTLVAGTTLGVAGSIGVANGSLSATSTEQMTIGGDAIASGDLTLAASEIVLSGAGAQTLRSDSGDLTLDASVAKSSGSLTLSAGGAIDAKGSITVSGGSLTAVSAGDLTVAHAMTASQNVTLLSTGGGVVVDAAVEATGGNLSIESNGAMAINESLTAGQDIILEAGGDLDLAATSSLDAGRDITLASGGSVLLGTELDASGGSLSITSRNELVVNQALSARDNLTLTVTDGKMTVDAALTTLEGSVTLSASDDLTLNAALTSGGSISLESGGTLAIGVALDAAGGSLTAVSKGPLVVSQTLTALEDISLTSSIGGVTVDAVLTAGRDISIDANGDLAVNASLDAGRDITLASGGELTLGVALDASGGSIAATAVNSIVVNHALTARDNLSLTSTEGGVTLDAAVAATEGSVTVTASGGDLAVNQSLTAGQDITLDSSGTLTLGVALNASGGSLTATAANAIVVNNAMTARDDLSLTSTGGGITVNTQLQAQDGSVTLIAGGGDLVVSQSVAAGESIAMSTAGTLTLGGNANAGSDLSLSASQINLTGGGAQSLVAGSGALAMTGPVSKLLGDLVLTAGTTLNANGSISVGTGRLTATAGEQMTFGGDLTSAGDLSLSGSSILLSGGGAQEIRSNDGAVSIEGDLTKAIGDLTLSAATTLSASGSLTATAGSLTATSTGATILGGDATAGTNLILNASEIVLSGSEAQLLQAVSGDLTLNAAVNKAEGDLTLVAGGALSANGAITVDEGSLSATSVSDMMVANGITASGSISLESTGGDLTVAAALAAGEDIVLAADGDLTVTVDLETAGGSITATSGGDMSLASATALQDVTLESGGTLTASGDLTATEGTLSVAAEGDVSLAGATSGGDMALASETGTLTATGDLSSGGSLSASSGGDMSLASATALQDVTLESGGTLTASGDLTATEGALSVAAEGAVSLAGATSGGDMTLTSTAGSLTASGDLTATEGTLSVTAEGDISLAGATSGGDMTLTSTTGSLTASGDLTANDGTLSVIAEGAVSLAGATSGGDMTLTSTAGTLSASGPLSSGGSLSATSDGLMTLGGSVSAARSLTLDAGAGNAIEISSDLSAGMGQGDLLQLLSDVTLLGNSRWSGREIRAEGRIDGHHELAINAGSSATFLGNIGEGMRLAAFDAESGFIVFGDGSAPFRVAADRFRLLQTSQAPGFAVDMVSLGDLLIETDLFDVTTGRKITVLGDFTIDADGTGSVTIGDVNTGGLFTISAAEIFLRLREPGTSATAIGPLPDTGLDLIALGGFDFSVAPTTIGGGGVPIFSSPNAAGDLRGTLGGFIMLDSNLATTGLAIERGGLGISLADLYNASTGAFFDLVAYNGNNENVATLYAGASQANLEVSDEDSGTVFPTDELAMLERIFGEAFDLRSPSAAELRELLSGSAVLVDHEVGGAAAAISGLRLGGGRLRELLEASERLEAATAADPATFRAAAGELLAAYRSGQPLARAAAAVVAAGDARKAAAMGLIGQYLRHGESLGLSPTERRMLTAREFPEGFWPQTAIPGLLGENRPTDPLWSFDVPAAAFNPAFWAALGQSSGGGDGR